MTEKTDLKFSEKSWELAQVIAANLTLDPGLGDKAKAEGEALAEFFIAFLTKINSADGQKSHAE